MRNRLIGIGLLAFTVLFLVTGIDAKERKMPTYEELFEQQLLIYETKRYIERAEQEKEELEVELPLLEKRIEEKKEVVALQTEEVKPILLKLYSGQEAMWAELFLELETLEDVMTVYHVSETYTDEQMTALNDLNEELKQLQEEEASWKAKRERLGVLMADLTEQLKKLQEEEETFAYKMGLVDDVEKAKKEVAALIHQWETKGLNSFNELFGVMARSISKLPSAVDKSAIKMKSLFWYEASVTDDELNTYLQKQETLFRDIAFTFDDGEMKMGGTYEGLMFEASGYYELVSEQEMRFHLNELQFENVRLPSVTMLELEEQYDLGFYPDSILDGAKVKKIEIDDGVFRVEIEL